MTTFGNYGEFEKATTRLDSFGLSYEVVSPEMAYCLVGAPALVVDARARAALSEPGGPVCSGWVEYRPARITVPDEAPPGYDDDVFGEAAIVVLAPCVADPTKIRIIAHTTGDLTEALPYLNAEMETACYNKNAPSLTFMDGYRTITLYPRRVAVAKADEIVDAWRTLEQIRRGVNDVWSRREKIEPCYEMRERPPAIEIFKRLPRTNCRACGEPTCLAFAVKVHAGEVPVTRCEPVFGGDYARLREALVEICGGIGVAQ